jgi:RHS repeat-associated protein
MQQDIAKKLLAARLLSVIVLGAVFGLKANGQAIITLDQPNTGGEHVASQSVRLLPGFSSASGFHAYINSSANCIPLATNFSDNQNYIVTSIARVPGIPSAAHIPNKNICEVNQSVQYFDGLGRPLQTVQVKGNPDATKDMVQAYAYDDQGREVFKYLPYAADGTANGSYKANALSAGQGVFGFYNPPGSGSPLSNGVTRIPTPFSQTVFENSPLNRVLEQGAPGDAWQPGTRTATGGRTVVMEYATNAQNEVKLWTVGANGASSTSYYAVDQLYKTISKDENWTDADGTAGTTEEFKDKEGNVVLKRVFNRKPDNSIQSLSTYYVYDGLNNLRYVLPPAVNENGQSTTSSFTETDAVFLNFLYGYHYDDSQRLIEKKIPGKGWEYTVYNTLDQVVMTQDAVQRSKSPQQWTFSKYDALGRTVLTGIWIDDFHNGQANISLRGDLQSIASSTRSWETRDINNTVTGYSNDAIPQGGIGSYLSISYYDDYTAPSMPTTYSMPNGAISAPKGLPTASKVAVLNNPSDMLWTVNYYDDEGRTIKTYAQNYLGGIVSVNNYDAINTTYGFTGEVLTTSRNHNNGTLFINNEYTYDHMGRKLETKQYTGTSNATPNQSLSKLEYNEIAQLKKKELGNGMQCINYAYNERGWIKTAKTSGNLFDMELQYNNYSDASKRQWNGNISAQIYTNGGIQNTFNYIYDKLNRLKNGTATGMSEALDYDVMGNITSLSRDGGTVGIYTYVNGNQLDHISGGSLATGAYLYDANGNVKIDGRNGKNITYNMLNLPQTLSGDITFTYTALGQKLRKQRGNLITEYIGGIQYSGTEIDFVQTEVGIARNNQGNFTYEYNLNDHLGNTRATFYRNPNTQSLMVTQRDDFYPFGIRKSMLASSNNYLYNSKELQEDLGQYDYGARFYDPIIARWSAIDPLAEIYSSFSNYIYAVNNPILFIDPNGMAIVPVEGGYKFTEEDAKSAFSLINKSSSNVYLAITNKKSLQNEFNHPNDDNLSRNGQWSVFGAANFSQGVDALNTLGNISNFSLDNLVIETHGGIDSKGIANMKITDIHSLDGSNFITNIDLSVANGIYPNATLANNPEIASKLVALKQLADKVGDGGNLIFASCISGTGKAGAEFGQNINLFTGQRINNFLAKDFVKPRYYRDSGRGVWFSRMFENTWLQTTPKGKQFSVSSIKLSATIGTKPVTIVK